MSFDIPLISALTALVAVVVSPVVSIYVAKYQVRGSVVSVNRQKWIDDLRGQLSELIADIRTIGLHRKINLLSNEEYESFLQRMLLAEIKIALLLNPKEEDHNALLRIIKVVIAKVFSGDEEEKRRVTEELLPEIISQTQAILKREWERVKASK